MVTLTCKEKEAIIILFKDFSNYYNANSISKVLHISRIGAMKILKKLLNENLLISKKIGKSIIYKIRLDDDYLKKLLAFLLADEANNFKRWKEEFKELFKGDRIIMLYGSTIKNYNNANDIDLLLIIKKSDYKEITKIIEQKQKILPKKIHSIELTSNDFLQNIRERKKVTIDTIKNAIILYGQDKYVDIMKNVSSF
jgi:predicted transcriptional regulator